MDEGEELLWSVQELSAVRETGLVGALVGCLPRAPRQNTRLGRPLLLRAEERRIIREEHLQLQRQTPREEHLQLRRQPQTPREEHLHLQSQTTREEHLHLQSQTLREEHLHLQSQTPREEHLQLQRQTPREEHLQLRRQPQTPREEHLHLQSQTTREEHLQLQRQTPREEHLQLQRHPQTPREEHLQLQRQPQTPREEHLHLQSQTTREEHLHLQRQTPREEHLQLQRQPQTPREEHLHLQSQTLREEHLHLHPDTDQSQPSDGPTETPNSLTELSADAHTEETEGGGPVGPSDGQQGAAGPERRSEEELTETQELQWEEFLSRSLEEQQQRSLNDRKSALTSSLSDRVSEAELASRLSSLEQSFLFPRSALTLQLSTCRQGLPLQPIRSQDLPLQPIRSEDLPLQPIRSKQQSPEPMGVRLQVFRDLRRRGFFLTSGGKFGVDFLVYPGDPLRFHAHFMALCLPVGGSMSVAELLSCVRLSSNVKKTLLLCSVCPPGGVLYSSLQWSHMS